MKLTIKDSKKPLTSTDLLVVFGLQGKPLRLPGGVRVPPLAKSSFKGEFREARLTDAVGGPAKRVLQIGLGKPAETNTERLRRAGAIAARKAEKVRARSIALWIDAREFQGAHAAVALDGLVEHEGDGLVGDRAVLLVYDALAAVGVG